MTPTDIAFLTALITLSHGDNTYLHTVEVRQAHRGTTLWSGPVAVFQLHGHATATECYAWMIDEIPNTTCPVMFLNSKMVDSPSSAVRTYVRQLCQELAA